VGGGGRGQDWSEHEEKNVALTQRGKDGGRGARAADIPLVVLDGDGFRPVERSEILLNAMLKIAQCRGVDVELSLQVGAHCLFDRA